MSPARIAIASAVVLIGLAIVIGDRNETGSSTATVQQAGAASATSVSPSGAATLDSAGQVRARAIFARETENRFLDAGVDTKVSAVGKGKTTIRIEYDLGGRVFAHEIEKAENFWKTARELGVTRIEYIGYDYSDAWELAGDRWYSGREAVRERTER